MTPLCNCTLQLPPAVEAPEAAMAQWCQTTCMMQEANKVLEKCYSLNLFDQLTFQSHSGPKIKISHCRNSKNRVGMPSRKSLSSCRPLSEYTTPKIAACCHKSDVSSRQSLQSLLMRGQSRSRLMSETEPYFERELGLF